MDVENDVTNVAQVIAADQPDADSTPDNDIASEDDQDEITVGGTAADLELYKSVWPKKIGVGGEVTFTIVVENNGSANTDGVEVTDQLPEGLELVDFNTSVGTYNPGSGIWNIGELYVGEQEFLEITATVTGAGAFTNVAQVTDSDQPDPDSTPDNNNPIEDDQDEATVVGEVIDLQLAKTTNVNEILVGDEFVYTFGGGRSQSDSCAD